MRRLLVALTSGVSGFALSHDLGTGTGIRPPVAVPGGTVDTRDVKLTDDIVRAGMNWKFNWESAPLVPARY